MRRNRLSRRNLLVGTGGITLSLPWLASLGPRRAHAAASDGRPCRFIAVSHHQGTVHSQFTPTGSEAEFALPALLAPCEPFRSHLLPIAGLDNRVAALNMETDPHNSADTSLFTHQVLSENMLPDGTLRETGQANGGTLGGPSIDQALAQRIGSTTPFSSIDLAIGSWGDSPPQVQAVDSLKFAVGRDQPVNAIVDPRLTFAYLFSDPGLTDPAALEALLARRLSVLDAVLDNMNALSTRLSADDRVRLEAHADKVRQIEQRLQLLPNCESAEPSLPPGYDHIRDDDVSARVQIDLLVLAMACGLAHVATLNFTDGHGPLFPWIEDPQPIVPPPPVDWDGDPNVDPPPTGYTEWHDMIHRGLHQDEAAVAAGLVTEPGIVAGMGFYSDTFAYLLEQLQATPDAAGGTMLDTTTALWLSEFGNGGWHAPRRLPTVVAGSMGPDVEMGRFIDWEAPGDWSQGTYCTGQLFTSILHAFGFDDDSFGRTGNYSLTNSFGDPIDVQLPTGPLPL